MPQKKSAKSPERIEKERDFYGIGSLVLHIATILTLLTPINSLYVVVLPLMLLFANKNYNRSIRELGRLKQLEASHRIGESLSTEFPPPKNIIHSALFDERLRFEELAIDYLLTLPSKNLFAISVRTILPALNKPRQLRVYFDNNKNKLGYRKSIQSGKKYFNQDPIFHIKEGTNWIKTNHFELLPDPPIHIVVMADPIFILIHPGSPVTHIEGETYLYIDDVYVVEEARLLNLIQSIDKEKVRQSNTSAKIGSKRIKKVNVT